MSIEAMRQAREAMALLIALTDTFKAAQEVRDIEFIGPQVAAAYDALTPAIAALDTALAAPAEPVAWGQLGTLNGKTYLRIKYDRMPYPPPADVALNLNLVPLYTTPPAPEAQS
jgi:hypothetical protein